MVKYCNEKNMHNIFNVRSNEDKKKWAPIKYNISVTNKLNNRRIDFHKATKSSTSFDGGSESTSKSLASYNINDSFNNNNNNDNNNSLISNSIPGLFDPLLVLKYLKWKKISRPGPGLYNHGNTCYLNSTLQCLLHTASLTQTMIHEEFIILQGLNKFGDNKTILQFFQKLVKEAWSLSPGKSISPRSMVQNIRRVGKQFKPMRQEDAHEYLRLLLDCMHEEILKARGVSVKDNKIIAETTIISRIFGGYLCNELICSECYYSSKTFNHFQDLSVEVSHSKLKCVNDAINAFIRVEILSDGNEWKCDGCKKKVKARKQMTVYKAPNVLVLHLKRFSFGDMFGKITKTIEFGKELYLPCSGEDTKKVKYELSSMIVHHGSSVHGGHYVAFIKAPNGQWYEMNDSQVSGTSINKVLKQQAYVLFYTKVFTASNYDSNIKHENKVESNLLIKKELSHNHSPKLRLKPRLIFMPTPFRWKGPIYKFFKQFYNPFKRILIRNTSTSNKDKIKKVSDKDQAREENNAHDKNDFKIEKLDSSNKFNTEFDTHNDEILRNFMRKNDGTVGSWETASRYKLNEIENISRKQLKSEQRVLGSRQSSEWDKSLDKGRMKKVKSKISNETDDENKINQFQTIIETRKREDTYLDNDKTRMKKRRR
jgi:ubiquitin C-terminal hydrolase